VRAGTGWIAGVWRRRADRRLPGGHAETAARGLGESTRRPRRATTRRRRRRLSPSRGAEVGPQTCRPVSVSLASRSSERHSGITTAARSLG